MCCVPIAAIKDADGVLVCGRERLEVANEPMLVIDLRIERGQLAVR